MDNLGALRVSGFRFLIGAVLSSGASRALIPIAFAIETVRVESRGWGMAIVLSALWTGRFLGMLMYKKIGNHHHVDICVFVCWRPVYFTRHHSDSAQKYKFSNQQKFG